jgi:hypothetical protein
MNNTLFDRIREENIKKYGTHVEVYGPVLLSNLYSDRTHFIYELLQNAEDACERARKQGSTKRFSVRFELYPDRLEVRHNGIPFDDKDVTGICGIVEATKDKDIPQIGKFGIGFKSVYAYSTSPEIYSEDRCFYVQAYVRPYAKEPRKDVPPGETLFVIPFGKEPEELDLSSSEIGNRLKNLGARTLLFLKNIEEISYKMGSAEGKYSRQSETTGGTRKVALQYIDNGQEKLKEKWLVFDKPSNKDKSRNLEIAYQLVYDTNLRSWRINPAKDVKLFVYFSTEKETHLSFLIQGPFNTTPARDNMRDDEWNHELIEETATFVADTITKVKSMGLLDAQFLNTLPIDSDYFTSEKTMFGPIYEKVKEKLSSDEPLLPTVDHDFVTVNQAFIARGKDLRMLLKGQQLDLLFERKGSKWLDENITEDKTPELRGYLVEVLGIEEVYPELFARAFTEEFIIEQDDQWVMSFYAFLLNQRALWKDAEYSYERSGILRSKPIIRLQDDSHVLPFDDDGNSVAYVAHKDPSISKMFPRLVKDTIAADKKSREFLRELGITEPDKVAAIRSLILPLYDEEEIPENDNIRHIEWILSALEDCEGNRKSQLLDELERTPFLYAVNALDQRKEYRKPVEIHLGEKYTSSKDLETFFDGNEETWFLDQRYLALANPDEMAEKLRQLGCRSAIVVNRKKTGSQGSVIIENSWGDHKRGLDGFDPECEVEGLEYALENVNMERSKILWQIAKECHQSIYGEVESSSKQNYEGSTKNWQYSSMGKLLVENPWLPDSKTLSFHKPAELTLQQLPTDFDKESTEAKHASQVLGFKPAIDEELQTLLEKTSDESAREIVEIVVSASPELRDRMLEALRTMRISEKTTQTEEETKTMPTTTIFVSPSIGELDDEFQRALRNEGSSSATTEDRTWRGPTPEQEEKIRELELEELRKVLKKPPPIEREYKQIGFIKAGANEEEELRKFLLEQYRGHCQICNTKLDLGPNKDPYFEVYHLIEKRRPVGPWSFQGFNVLCLCPNCHALMKFGGRDLKGITERAEKTLTGEVAPEEVSERHGDFYIVPVIIAGREKELFLAPFHMAKISAFLKLVRKNLGG